MQIPVVNVKNMNTVYGKKGRKSIIRILEKNIRCLDTKHERWRYFTFN